MPVSKGRRRPSHTPTPAPPPRRSRARWRKWLGWPLVAVGGVLFLLGNIGARTGIVFLPFDPHHVIGQFGGAILAVVGLIWATGK